MHFDDEALPRKGSSSFSNYRPRPILKCVYQTKLSTASTDDEERGKFLKELKDAGIECYEVLSESVAYLMERIDVVILGAEAVVESGSGWFFVS